MAFKATQPKPTLKPLPAGKKVKRVGYSAWIKEQLQRAPKTAISLAKLATAMENKFHTSGKDKNFYRAYISGIHHWCVKNRVACSALVKKAWQPASKPVAKPASKPASKPISKSDAKKTKKAMAHIEDALLG